eukprot:12404576-Karenia_brevis.AAC.1
MDCDMHRAPKAVFRDAMTPTFSIYFLACSSAISAFVAEKAASNSSAVAQRSWLVNQAHTSLLS